MMRLQKMTSFLLADSLLLAVMSAAFFTCSVRSTVDLRGVSSPGKCLAHETLPRTKQKGIIDVAERPLKAPEVLQMLMKGQLQ